MIDLRSSFVEDLGLGRIARLPFAALAALSLAAGCVGAPTDSLDLEFTDASDEVDDEADADAPQTNPDGQPSLSVNDELVSEGDPAAACTSCAYDFFFSCGNTSWQYACPANALTVGPIGDFCAECATLVCQFSPATGEVDASPQQVPVANATACTTIEWDSCTNAQVWVSHNGAAETLFAQGVSGTQDACWIQANHDYQFCLYEGTDHSNQLDCVTVQGYPADPPPDPCNSCPFGQSCHCEPGVCYPNNQPCQ
ncbi:MAG: hypothetical protein K0V04_36405 [Deltaproteobacteria bacterium]|nr:hypothetical protein [Deltaproteobacteria bacterium]